MPTSFWTLIHDKNDKNILGVQEEKLGDNDLYVLCGQLRKVLQCIMAYSIDS